LKLLPYSRSIPAANTGTSLHRGRALGGVTVLDLTVCNFVTDDVIVHLPPSLRALNVSNCNLTEHASFTHLPALEWLDCSGTKVAAAGLSRLPPTLRELHARACSFFGTADFSHLRHLRVLATHTIVHLHNPLSAATIASLPPSLEVLDLTNDFYYAGNLRRPRGWSLAHLARLRMLKASHIDDAAIASLPPSLQQLDLAFCDKPQCAASFAHLTCLHSLNLRYTPISSDTLASLPPSLVSLDLHETIRTCHYIMLTPDTVFPHLPALRVLNVSDTDIGNAAVASMPGGLEELHIVNCRSVTQGTRLDHLTALQVLQSAGTNLSPATLVACRARGCFAPADGGLIHKRIAELLVLLPDGRLVSSGRGDSRLVLWEATGGCDDAVVAELKLPGVEVHALAVLHDGHRVAVGNSSIGIVVWDTRATRATRATIDCDAGVLALATARNDGCLVAGCDDGKLRVVNVDAGAVVAKLKANAGPVTSVAVLLDGRVAAASDDCKVRLWDLDTRTRISTLAGHTDDIISLAALPDGRLASGSKDETVRLWDTASGTCIRVLTGHKSGIDALAVLPNLRLASLSCDKTIRVWDTHDDTSGTRPPVVIDVGVCMQFAALLPLPDDRLLTGCYKGAYLWHLSLSSDA